MQVSTLINDVAKELGDPSMVTWNRPTLISLLNQAVKQVILVRPDANSVTENITLVAGTKQSLSVDSLRLLKAVRNMGATGSTPGKSLKYVDSETLDAFDPDWHSNTPVSIITSYTYDESTPSVMFVNPPSDGTTQIEIQVSKIPVELDVNMDDITFNDPATVIGLKDIYSNPLMEWILYKAFSFESSSSASLSTANTHMQSFYNALGVKLKSDVMNSPTGKSNGSA